MFITVKQHDEIRGSGMVIIALHADFLLQLGLHFEKRFIQLQGQGGPHLLQGRLQLVLPVECLGQPLAHGEIVGLRVQRLLHFGNCFVPAAQSGQAKAGTAAADRIGRRQALVGLQRFAEFPGGKQRLGPLPGRARSATAVVPGQRRCRGISGRDFLRQFWLLASGRIRGRRQASGRRLQHRFSNFLRGRALQQQECGGRDRNQQQRQQRQPQPAALIPVIRIFPWLAHRPSIVSENGRQGNGAEIDSPLPEKSSMKQGFLTRFEVQQVALAPQAAAIAD